MAATLYVILSLALFPLMTSASVDIEFRLRESTLTSDVICCGQETADASGCLSGCPFRLQFCLGTNERLICSKSMSLDQPNPGNDVAHISLDYIKSRMEFHLLLVTDTEEEEILSDVLFLTAGDIRIVSGKYTEKEFQYSLTASITVTCDPDFYGKDCSIYCISPENCSRFLYQERFVDPESRSSARADSRTLSCPKSKCENFGTCDNGVCLCVLGFTGDLCEIDILECASNPCVHGRCIEPNVPNTYTCECDEGYAGQNCDVPTNTSINALCPECYYNGTCYVKPAPPGTDHSTGCQTNQYGTKCNVRCVPQNSCGGGHYECNTVTGEKECLGGWSGDNCTVRNVSKSCDSECPNVRCKNDGTCFNGTCCCLPKYTGKYCERVKIFCDQDPCKNNGMCTDTDEGYSCQCTNGFSGRNCENIVTTPPTTILTSTPATTKSTKRPTTPTAKPTTSTSRPTTTVKQTTQSTSTTKATTTSTTIKPTTTTTKKPTSPTTTFKPNTPAPTTKPTLPTTTAKAPTTEVSTTERPTTTAKPMVTHNLLVNGKIDDKDISKLEKLVNDVLKNQNCTKGATIVNYHHLINENREQVTSVDIASDCINGTSLDPKTVATLNNLFGRTEPFRTTGNHIFGQQMSPLKDLAQSHSLSLVGYVYNQNEDIINRKIVNAWNTSHPNIPNFKVLIVLREYFIGNYGTHVTNLRYFVTSRFQLLDPKTTSSPTTAEFEREFNKLPVVNSLYSGHALYKYTEGIRLPVMDNTFPVTSLANPLGDTWSKFLKSNNSTPRKASPNVRIILSGREPCFWKNRTDLQSSIYFPILANNSLLTFDLRFLPDTNGLTTTACRSCYLLRQFYIDVSGRILLRDRDAIYRMIREARKSTRIASQFEFTEKQYFKTNEGDVVTRLWYTHPIDTSDRLDSWPHPNMDGRWDAISNGLTGYTLNTVRVGRVYRVVLQGDISLGRRSEVTQKLHQAWSDANKHISPNAIQINIVSWSSNYYSINGNAATRIDYKVTVATVDSSQVSVESPSKSSVVTFLGQASLRVCLCLVYQQRDIGVVGKIGTDDSQTVQNAISSVWESANPGLSLDISGHVKKMLEGYESKAGDKATKVVYFVSPFIHGTPIDEDDLVPPPLADIKLRVEAVLPGTTVEEHPLVKATAAKNQDEDPSWLVPVAVAAGVLGFLLLMAIITACIKRHSHKKSKTLNQNPERVEGYDKEHFSEAPDLDNSLNVDDPQWMENEKHKTYIVNDTERM
ncbi:uncharacterized protein [Argopecten irradians]|uniref:uncharacterized protein n=1 Tax=Argopecten irradians TaxID=31199 RepID=UPI003719213B